MGPGRCAPARRRAHIWPLAAGRWPLAAGRWPIIQVIQAAIVGRCQVPVRKPCERPGAGGRGRLARHRRCPVRRGRRSDSRHSQHGGPSSDCGHNPDPRLVPGTAALSARPVEPFLVSGCHTAPPNASLLVNLSCDCRNCPPYQHKFWNLDVKRQRGRPVREPDGERLAGTGARERESVRTSGRDGGPQRRRPGARAPSTGAARAGHGPGQEAGAHAVSTSMTARLRPTVSTSSSSGSAT